MIATEMVKHFGMSDKVGVRIVDLPDGRMSNSTREQVDQEVKRLLQVSRRSATCHCVSQMGTRLVQGQIDSNSLSFN